MALGHAIAVQLRRGGGDGLSVEMEGPMPFLPAGIRTISPDAPSSTTAQTINLLRGWPAPELLPARQLAAACQRVLLTDKSVYTPILEYGADEGYQPLRQGLASWLGRHYGVLPDPERICITGGASQNLACILQSFSDAHFTRAVWAVTPVYHLAVPIFEDAGFAGRVRAAPEDDDGVNVEALEQKIQALEKEEQGKDFGKPFKETSHQKRKLYRHLIYLVPTCANPSGKSMPVSRREALVKLARKYNALVICDDVYDFLQWPTDGPVAAERPSELRFPRLCDIERSMELAEHDPHGFGHTVSNGSFSKISGPGVRTGWAEASPAFMAGLAMTGSTRSGGAPSQLCAAMLADLIDNGELEQNIEQTLRPALQRRHGLLTQAVRDHLGPYGVTATESSLRGKHFFGGYFLWLRLKAGCSAELLAHVAKEEENVVIGFGNMFSVHGDGGAKLFDNHFRLCFAWAAEEELVEGVRRLGDVLNRIEQNKEQYKSLEQKILGKANLFSYV